MKYHKFEHFRNNYPLDEYERLAKHMKWGPNHYKDHKKMLLQTLTNVKGKWQYKNEGYKSQNNFKKDKYEDNSAWWRKVDSTKIIYEKKEIKDEEISKNPNQNYFKEDENESTEKIDQKIQKKIDYSKKESIDEKNKEIKLESNPENKQKKIEINDQIKVIRNDEKQIGISLNDNINIKNLKNEIPLRKFLESSKINQVIRENNSELKNSQTQQKQHNKKNIAEIEKNDSDSEEEKKVNLNQQYHKPVSDSSSEEKKNCNDTIEFERDINLDGNFKLKDDEFSFEKDFCYDTYNCEWNRGIEDEVFSGEDD